jgi:hypothetical protein
MQYHEPPNNKDCIAAERGAKRNQQRQPWLHEPGIDERTPAASLARHVMALVF